MFKIENVSKKFGTRKILDAINLEIKEKTITTITGVSGSGKTTLLGVISGLLKPDSGRVLYNGKNIFNWIDLKRSHFRNKTIGFVFQFFNLLPDITAYRNILYPVMINPFAKSRKAEADYLVEYLNLSEIKDQYPDTLSGGERQRVAIARAIINQPKLVIADEPTGNLDDAISKDIMRLFVDIRDRYGISFLIATHDKDIVKLADSSYHIDNGKITNSKKVKARKTKGKTKNKKEVAAQKQVKSKSSKKTKVKKK